MRSLTHCAVGFAAVQSYSIPRRCVRTSVTALLAFGWCHVQWVLADSSEDVRQVVLTRREFGVPFVARGAGTGLSGGALPTPDGIDYTKHYIAGGWITGSGPE